MRNYYLLYKITNLLNNKFYIGVHSTKNINDNYFGSGAILKKAINKYGKVNFKKEILLELNSKEEMYEIESLFVDLIFINRPDVYNARVGGRGGFSDLDRAKGQITLKFNKESIIAKRKNTNLLKYGYESSSQHISVKKLVKRTKLEKHGLESYNNIEKNKQTVLEKYGVSNVMYVPDIVEKIQTTKNLNGYVGGLRGKTNPRALTYEFISPSGYLHVIIGEFEAFCLKHDLSFGKMCRWKNKGKIVNTSKTNVISKFLPNKYTNNCIGWEVKLVSCS